MPSVFRSTVLPFPINEVWPLIRDFGRLSDWHPLILDSVIENNAPQHQVGCVRHFKLTDGGLFREKLLALNDFKKTLTYTILESPLPLTDYCSTMKLQQITVGNQTFITWSSSFACPVEAESELITAVGDTVYQGGFDALATYLS